VTKVLATRLAPHLSSLVNNNQSAFIRGRSIHDNFMAVQLACRWLHCRNLPAVLLKVDIAKAFDSVLLGSFLFTSFATVASRRDGRSGSLYSSPLLPPEY
jgi:hypothetical protein